MFSTVVSLNSQRWRTSPPNMYLGKIGSTFYQQPKSFDSLMNKACIPLPAFKWFHASQISLQICCERRSFDVTVYKNKSVIIAASDWFSFTCLLQSFSVPTCMISSYHGASASFSQCLPTLQIHTNWTKEPTSESNVLESFIYTPFLSNEHYSSSEWQENIGSE